jgi:hypothetical protein
MPNMELQDLMFALLGFSLALIQAFLSISLFLSFEMEMFTTGACLERKRF